MIFVILKRISKVKIRDEKAESLRRKMKEFEAMILYADFHFLPREFPKFNFTPISFYKFVSCYFSITILLNIVSERWPKRPENNYLSLSKTEASTRDTNKSSYAYSRY